MPGGPVASTAGRETKVLNKDKVNFYNCASSFFRSFAPLTIRNGWRIVAVEQAEESVPLQDFVFPAKTVLLLGKEREGVPVELLNKVQLYRIRNLKILCHLRWMIVWRSPRVGWSAPSTSTSPAPSSSGRRSSSCPSCRRRQNIVVSGYLDPSLSSRSCLCGSP